MVKEQENASKKEKYHAGVAVKNRRAGLRQANYSYSAIYKTLKAEEIPISLSIKREKVNALKQRNVVRKKGSGRLKASSCKDDHLLKCTVLKDRKRSLQKLSAEFKTSENKTLLRRTMTRRLFNAGFYNSECISTTVKHGGRGVMVWGAFSAAGTGELLHCEKSINALESRRILQKGLPPTIEKLFSKAERSDVIFQQDNAPAHTAKTTKTWVEKSIRVTWTEKEIKDSLSRKKNSGKC